MFLVRKTNSNYSHLNGIACKAFEFKVFYGLKQSKLTPPVESTRIRETKYLWIKKDPNFLKEESNQHEIIFT